MKALSLAVLIAMALVSSCGKSLTISPTGDWRLVHKYSSIGSSYRVLTPAPDSSVSLSLNTNDTYTTWLGNTIVSQGSYSISIDSGYYNQQVLQFNNFKPTGIFALFTVTEIGSNNQVLSVFNGMFMHISHDSLTLAGALTPGGSVSYLFVKK